MGLKTKNEEKNCTNRDALMVAGGCVLSVALLATGFMMGQKYSATVTNLGLQTVFNSDPTLEEHMTKVLNEVLNK